MFKKISILLLMVISLSSNLLAQNNFKGTVYNSKGEKLTGANVLIKSTTIGTTSDANGNFELKNVSNGQHILQVSFMGYNAQEVSIEVPQMGQNLVIHLKESDIFTGEVNVKATRANDKTPFAFSNISQDDIKSRNTGEDIPFLLALEPSIVTTSETGTGFGYTGMRVRGSDATRINITVNGIPLNDSESHGVYWVNMPDFANSVSNIQIQRGVGTSTNGSGAFGASINFKTKGISRKAFAEIDAAVGSFNTYKTSVNAGSGLINEHFAVDVRLSRMESDGFVRNAFADHKSFGVNAAYITDKSLLQASIFSGNQRTGITWWGNPKEMLEVDRTYNPAGEHTDYYGNKQYYTDETDNYIQTHYQLHFSHEFNSNLNLSAALHYTRGDGFYEEYKPAFDGWGFNSFEAYGLPNIVLGSSQITVGDKVFDFPDQEISATDMIRRKLMANDFYGAVFSLNYATEKVDFSFGAATNIYDGDHFGKILWTQWNADLTKNHEWYFNNGTKKEFNTFAKANYEITNNLNAYADIQFRHIGYKMNGIDDDLKVLDQTHNFNFVNPKVGLFYQVNENQNIYVSFAMANREPTRTNFKDATGDSNSTPKAETLMDYEAGYSYSSEIFAANANFYYMDYNDQLVLTGQKSSVGYDIMTNVAKSHRTGIEISVAVKPLEFIQWKASLTLSENKIENYIEYAKYYDADWNKLGYFAKELGETDISYSPNVIASSQLTFIPIKNLNISIISKYVGDQYYDNTSSENRKIDAYFVNNALITYNFDTKKVKNISLMLQINNLFNLEYSNNAYGGYDYLDGKDSNWSYYFPQAGINFLSGIRLSF